MPGPKDLISHSISIRYLRDCEIKKAKGKKTKKKKFILGRLYFYCSPE
jgi:hypothetical protein